MSATVAWFRARVAGAAREPRLASALLGRRYARYALRRLRGFAMARGAAAGLWVLEAAVLLSVLPGRLAILTFLATHVSTLVGGAWWGATEQQRIAVREATSTEDADRLTAAWLRASLGLAAIVLAVAVAVAVVWRDRPLTAAYACVLGIRVAVDLPLRVWHARISATRRVFRAMWLQLGVEAVGPVIVLALHAASALDAWGFFAAMAAASVASRATTFYFVRRAYLQALAPWVRPARSWRAAAAVLSPQMLGCAIAGVATRVPSVLGLVLLASSKIPVHVAVGLHMTVGALAAASGWAWSHYQDFFAVASPILSRARRRLERLMIAEAVAVGILVGAAAVVIVWLWAPRSIDMNEPGVGVIVPPKLPSPVPYAAALPAIALGFSLLAAAQVIAWTRRAFLVVAVTGLAACAAVRLAGTAWVHKKELAASTVRVEHLAMGAAMAACALALWLVARRTPTERSREVPWVLGRTRADAVTFTTARMLVRELDARLTAAGATWWTRRERRWVVGGLDLAAVRAVARDFAGLVANVEPYALPAGAPVAPKPATHAFSFAARTPVDLDDRTLEAVWIALVHRLHGAKRGGDVAIVELVVVGDQLESFTARVR